MRDQIVLAKIRQQPRAEQRQTHDSGETAWPRRIADQHARTSMRATRWCAAASACRYSQKSGLGPGLVLRHHQHAHGRRRAHRDQQRQADGEQERNRQRPEERALQSGHHQDRQERDRHGRRGVEHRAPDLERGADEQLDDVDARVATCGGGAGYSRRRSPHRRPRRRARRRVRPSVMVLSDNPNASRIQTVVSKRERNRAEGDQCAAPVAQRDQQQRNDEHGADEQRIAQLLDRAFDEAGGPQQRRDGTRRPAWRAPARSHRAAPPARA